MSKFARRVDQLDAIYLDEELLSLLTAHYRKSFQYLPNSLATQFGPELDTLFKFFVKYLPLHILGGTFGQNLFQFQYRNGYNNTPATGNEIRALAFASVCLPWFWERVFRKCLRNIPNTDFSMHAIDVTFSFEQKFNMMYTILTLINFCIFLQTSTFPSVIERLLNIRPLSSAPQDLRPVIDDNIRRELLWYGMSEFIGFTLPLINVHKIKGYFKRTFLTRSFKHLYKGHAIQNHECAICGDIPNFPHIIGCSHVFCYYCIASIVMADPQYLCFDCDIRADGFSSIKPLSSNQQLK